MLTHHGNIDHLEVQLRARFLGRDPEFELDEEDSLVHVRARHLLIRLTIIVILYALYEVLRRHIHRSAGLLRSELLTKIKLVTVLLFETKAACGRNFSYVISSMI